jgi:hypothetical protein
MKGEGGRREERGGRDTEIFFLRVSRVDRGSDVSPRLLTSKVPNLAC